jgi:RHS repeat-associated protein
MATDGSGIMITNQGYRGYGKYRLGGILPTDHRYTGQKLDTATGLMYYGARYYDRHIGVFISPDTLVPDPTNLWDYNRFAYARLNPLKYNDPTGHCAFDETKTKITKTDCTVDDFHALSWEDRKLWMELFTQEYGLDNWFDDIKGAINILSADSDYSNLEGWAAYTDAGVLQAINDGMNLARGRDVIGAEGRHGGAAWQRFFIAFREGMGRTDENQLIVLRLAGEQGGVDYAHSLMETRERWQTASTREQLKIDMFLMGANMYRSRSIACRSSDSCWVNAYSDPRQATETRLFKVLGALPGWLSRLACPLCK